MNEQAIESASVNFYKQLVITRSTQDDLVEDLYRINVNSHIHELSNEFCKYYESIDIENGHEYFAIVFEKHFIPNFEMLQALKTSTIESINRLITYSIVKISSTKSYNLVAIVAKYNFRDNLFNYIEQHGALSAKQIENSLITSFATLINQCERADIQCGNINPFNIIVLDDGEFLLREPIISYPNFYQVGCYVAPELAECTAAGRVVYGTAADVYAFGITVFYALTGTQPWLDYEDPCIFNEDRFEQTTFRLLLNKRKISEQLRSFFKWVLHDNAIMRWQARNIFEWLAGHTPKTSSFEKMSEDNNLISFHGRNYSTLKSLAYALFCSWDEALQFTYDDRLAKWVQRNHVNNNIVEELYGILSREKAYNAFSHSNERMWKLTKLLSIIDPYGGIRQDGFAISAASIPTIIHYLNIKNKRVAIEQVVKIIKECYWSVNNNRLSATNVSLQLDTELKSTSKTFLLASPLFGLERVTYSLNPYTICFSPIVINEYVITLSELLLRLDDIATQAPEKFNIDRHIIAFIAAKIALKHESDVTILSNFPKFSEHYLIYGLCILNIAQKYEPDIPVHNLCKVITLKIIELFNEHLHNTQFKQNLAQLLTEDAETGDLSKVISRLNNQTDFMNDYNGYYNASIEVQRLKTQIQLLHSEDRIFDRAIFLGQKLTVLASYVLCFIVTVILIV